MADRITKAVSIDNDLAEWAEEQASQENRSFSNYVETLLKRIQEDEEARQPKRKTAAA